MSRFEISLLVILFAIWVPGLLQLAEVWRTVEYASHGFLIPFVALWAATAHRAELAMLPPEPVRGGLLLLGGVAILYLTALTFQSPTLLGLVTLAAGCATPLAFWGVATYLIGCLCLLGVGALMRRFLAEEEPGLST